MSSGSEKELNEKQKKQQEPQDINEKQGDNDNNIPIKSTDFEPTPRNKENEIKEEKHKIEQETEEDINEEKKEYNNNINELDFKLDEIDEIQQQKIRDLYYKQCPTLQHNEDQKDLFILLWLQRKNDYPLMIYLIDSYLRDRLQHFITFKSIKNLEIQEWGQKYKTIETLLKKEKEYKKIKEIMLGGMEMFFNRYCSPFSLPTRYKINDSMERFVQCLQEVYGLITAILQNPIQIPPFQIDLLIIPQGVIECIHETSDDDSLDDAEFDDDDDDDDEFSDDPDEDDDDDKEEEDGIKQQHKENNKGEDIGNIEEILKERDLKYALKEPVEPSMYREFRDLYNQYKNDRYGPSNLAQKTMSVQTSTLSESDSKECDASSPKSVCITETNNRNTDNTVNTVNGPIQISQTLSNSSADNIGGDLMNLPHLKRLCIVVDRRIDPQSIDPETNEVEEQNKIFMFETPSFNDIPKQYVKEWYFESSIQCIIPSINDNAAYNIKSKTSMNGWINIFSFHVEQKEEIRCYFYRDGKILRFMPMDIIDLFPELFDEKAYENQKFTESERKTKLNIDRLKWEDKDFNNFREQLNSQ